MSSRQRWIVASIGAALALAGCVLAIDLRGLRAAHRPSAIVPVSGSNAREARPQHANHARRAARRAGASRDPRPGRASLTVLLLPAPSAACASVVLRSGDAVVARRSCAEGRALFEDLPAGRFELALDRAQPGDEERRRVELFAGERKTIEWALERTGGIDGVVVAVDGSELTGLVVHVQRRGARRTITAIPDARGVFRVDGLRAGTYRLRVDWTGAAGAIAPLPLEVRVSAGSWAHVELAASTDETTTIRGRVVDRRGRPFRGLRVLCVPLECGELVAAANASGAAWNDTLARARTDEEGRFALPIPRTPVLLQVDPRELRPSPDRGLRAVRRAFSPLSVWPRDESIVLEDLVAERPAPFVVAGRLLADDPVARVADLTVDAVYRRPRSSGDPIEWTVRLPLDDDGAFRFATEWYDVPVFLRVRDRAGRAREERLDPRPGVRSALELRWIDSPKPIRASDGPTARAG